MQYKVLKVDQDSSDWSSGPQRVRPVTNCQRAADSGCLYRDTSYLAHPKSCSLNHTHRRVAESPAHHEPPPPRAPRAARQLGREILALFNALCGVDADAQERRSTRAARLRAEQVCLDCGHVIRRHPSLLQRYRAFVPGCDFSRLQHGSQQLPQKYKFRGYESWEYPELPRDQSSPPCVPPLRLAPTKELNAVRASGESELPFELPSFD